MYMGKQWRNNELLFGGVFYSVEMNENKNVFNHFEVFFLAEYFITNNQIKLNVQWIDF